MERKADTPVRKSRRRYEERNKDERKEKNKAWATSVDRQFASEIDEFLKKYNITKVALIYAGHEALRNQLGLQKQQDQQNKE